MARLTRTQKYAELRDQLANDREESKSTSQLAEFENKLKRIEDTLTPKKEEPVVVAAPAVEEDVLDQTVAISSLKDVFSPVVNTPVEEPVTVTKPVEQEIEDVFNTTVFSKSDLELHVVENPGVDSDYVEPETPVVEETVVETPVVEVPVVETTPVVEPVTVAPAVEETVEEKYSWEEFEDDFTADLDKIIADWKFEDIFNDSKEETPVVEETKVEEPVEVVEETHVVEEAPVVEETVAETVEETPVVEEVTETPVSFVNPFEAIENEISEAFDQIEETKVDEPVVVEEVEAVEVVEETPVTVETPVVEENTSYTDFFEMDDDETDSFEALFDETPVSLMEETKAEIDEYNLNSGEKNIMDIADTLVEEVRHPEQEEELDADAVIETPVEEVKEDDSEFSNTVSMEISKIMDEIKTQEETNPLAEVVEEPAVVEEKTEVFEHPVLTQALEEPEEVVEIKNLKEIDIEPVKDATISSTIPFIVSNDDDDEYDEDEEEGSNTILNIILIILIIILVAVLGLIIFYILKTKGII